MIFEIYKGQVSLFKLVINDYEVMKWIFQK